MPATERTIELTIAAARAAADIKAEEIIALDVSSHQARLTIRNPSGSAPQGDGLGSGIAGMRARVEQLGGHLSAGHAAGAWVVQAIVPLKAGDRCLI